MLSIEPGVGALTLALELRTGEKGYVCSVDNNAKIRLELRKQ